MLADPRLSQVLDDLVTRVQDGRPIRWHRLLHDTLGCQLHAGPDLASVTEMQWRLAHRGIATHLTSEWLDLRPMPLAPPPTKPPKRRRVRGGRPR